MIISQIGYEIYPEVPLCLSLKQTVCWNYDLNTAFQLVVCSNVGGLITTTEFFYGNCVGDTKSQYSCQGRQPIVCVQSLQSFPVSWAQDCFNPSCVDVKKYFSYDIVLEEGTGL